MNYRLAVTIESSDPDRALNYQRQKGPFSYALQISSLRCFYEFLRLQKQGAFTPVEESEGQYRHSWEYRTDSVSSPKLALFRGGRMTLPTGIYEIQTT